MDASSIVALTSVGLLGIGTAIVYKTGPHRWWRAKPRPLVRPLAVVFFGFNLAALGLSIGIHSVELDVYRSLVSAYYVLMVVYLWEIAQSAFGWVQATLWLAAATQIVATVFLTSAVAVANDNRLTVASVLQLFSAIWATAYDAIWYAGYDMPQTEASVKYSFLH